MTIKKFEVKEYNVDWPFFGFFVECPGEFEAEIDGNETLEELIDETIAHIIGNKEWAAFRSGETRIPYNNKVVDEKNGVAAFVLVNEGGRSIKEGVYGLHKNGKKLRGKLIDYDSNYGDNYFRYLVDRIEDGVLKYTKKTYERCEREFDLRKI